MCNNKNGDGKMENVTLQEIAESINSNYRDNKDAIDLNKFISFINHKLNDYERNYK
ncbi:MAG: hypothetical protein ABF651_00515 [Sporolactobacillus sp.]